jgi:hypothetical protein
MTKTYGELRQETYFRAAIEMYRLCVTIWEDNLGPNAPGIQTEANERWALSVLTNTYRIARELEDRGHEQTVASTRWSNRLWKERETAHSKLGVAA